MAGNDDFYAAPERKRRSGRTARGGASPRAAAPDPVTMPDGRSDQNTMTDDERTPTDPDLERIVERISQDHGFDVRGYKRTSLYRRIRKRMGDAGYASVEEYLACLEGDSKEFPRLIDTILINVTEFFRDPEAWEYLKEEVLRPLVTRLPQGGPIRAWSVGCATGAEPYSMAMCLAELLGEAQMSLVKVYATDVDEGVMAKARTGVYGEEDMQGVSPERRERFFTRLGDGSYSFRRELRSSVIFGQHNLLTDPPISRLDLLVCRNVLIYFDAETQQRILARFHYALRDDNCLFLGKAETLMARSLLFRAQEPRHRIFRRVPVAGVLESVLPVPEAQMLPRRARELRNELAGQTYVLQAVISNVVAVAVLLDSSLRLRLASDMARDVFHHPDLDQAPSFLELDEECRPVPLRLAIEDARSSGRTTTLETRNFCLADGTRLILNMEVRPIVDVRGVVTHVLLWGTDVTLERRMAEELEQTRHALEAMSEEVQTANEELETANEELQSTNEELETTNEELQSTNEELETTVEELQSTNEELETTNEELRARQNDLGELTEYQDMVLSSLDMGLFVLDRHLRITSWNRTCEETWGVREDEVVGHELLSLDIGLPLPDLIEPLQRVVHAKSLVEKIELEARNRRGRPIRCSFRLNALTTPDGGSGGAVVIMEGLTAGHPDPALEQDGQG
jgi:two-component system CheB/CheR fusion protein